MEFNLLDTDTYNRLLEEATALGKEYVDTLNVQLDRQKRLGSLVE